LRCERILAILLRMVKALARTFLLLATLGGISVRAQSVLVKNIVLVHGAWADGSGWKGVYDILVKDGFNVSIVQEPETSFKDDVAATKRVLARQEGPCILVAHSYGGAVITEAGNDLWLANSNLLRKTRGFCPAVL
jgi:pimeloyl-ACP methyl ester carboxylesterase